MKLSKKEILNNYEKYKYRLLSIGCIEIMTEDLFNMPFKDDDMFIVERKLEDLNLSQDEIKCFEDLKVTMKKLNENDKKIIINILMKEGKK